MSKLSLALPLLALVLCAGCSMNRSSTSTMGASASYASSDRTLYCKDGMYATKSMGCPAGLERDLMPAGQK